MTWEQFRHLHKDPRAIALWRWLFGPLLRWLNPGRRRILLVLGALVAALRHPIPIVHRNGMHLEIAADLATTLPVAALLLAYAVCCYQAALNFASLPTFVRQRPLIHLHAVFWVLVAVLWTTGYANPTLLAILAGCVIAMPFLIWRLSYLLQTGQRGRMVGSSVLDHVVYVSPVWGGTNTPYGKGFDYLRSSEAGDEDSLARSQLAGLKMFVLAFICSIGVKLIDGVVFGSQNIYRHALGDATLGLPTVDAQLQAPPGSHAAWVGWTAIYCDLFLQVLKLGVYGHVIVGYLRICGFNVFRNTYKPLLAETIVEFWNRYYYYFKELLVSFFFLPTFVRYFKSSPRMRLFAAVFASAFLGNLYYHAIQDPSLARRDWAALAAMLIPRAGYCFLLALGIFVSMQREQRRTRLQFDRPWPRRAMAILGVWTFFAIIRLFHHGDPTYRSRIEFILGLFGVA